MLLRSVTLERNGRAAFLSSLHWSIIPIPALFCNRRTCITTQTAAVKSCEQLSKAVMRQQQHRSQSRASSEAGSEGGSPARHQSPQFFFYDQQLRALMNNNTTNGASGFDAPSSIGQGEESLSGLDVQSLGMSFDGESILLPTTTNGGGEATPVTTSHHDFSTLHTTTLNSLSFGERQVDSEDRVFAAIVNERGQITLQEIRTPKPTRSSSKKISVSMVSPDDRVTDPSFMMDEASSQVRHRVPPPCASCCCPLWILDAPLFLRIYILGALVLFLGAMSLTIYTSYELGHISSSSSSSTIDNGVATGSTTGTTDSIPYAPPPSSSRNDPPNVVPTVPPTKVSSSTQADAASMITSVPTPSSTTVPSTRPTSLPTAVPSITPTVRPTPSPVVFDTVSVSFYVMAGHFPESQSSQLGQLPAVEAPQADGPTLVYQALPFLVHLGSWNSNPAQCPQTLYQSIAKQYQTSSVPVFFVLGDQEFNDCPNAYKARLRWRGALGTNRMSPFSQNVVDNYWQWSTQTDDHAEFFSFVLGTVLFVGLPMPNRKGSLKSNDWQNNFVEKNLSWIEQTYTIHKDSIQVMVFLTNNHFHAVNNPIFYPDLLDRIKTQYQQVHVILINDGDSDDVVGSDQAPLFGLRSQFEGVTNLDVIHVQGSSWPPTKVELTVDKPDGGNVSSVVTVEVDQDQWYSQLNSSANNSP